MYKEKRYKNYFYDISKAGIIGYNVAIYQDKTVYYIEWGLTEELAEIYAKEIIDRLYTLNIPVPRGTACKLPDSFIYDYHKRYKCSNAKWSHSEYYNGVTGDGKDLPCTLKYIS